MKTPVAPGLDAPIEAADLLPPIPPPRIGSKARTAWSIAEMVKAWATAAGFSGAQFGGHSLKRGALTTGMDEGEHPTRLRRLGRHKSFAMLGEYLELGDAFETHPLRQVL